MKRDSEFAREIRQKNTLPLTLLFALLQKSTTSTSMKNDGKVLYDQGGITVEELQQIPNVLRITRGMGPRLLKQLFLQQHKYMSPHYSAYKQNIVLSALQPPTQLFLTCACLVQDLREGPTKPEALLSYEISDHVYKFHIKLHRSVSSNELGRISMISVSNGTSLPPEAYNKVFRRVLKAHNMPVLGNAKLCVSFRGEALAMGLLSLKAKLCDGRMIHQELSIPPSFQALMDREERFASSSLPLYQTNRSSFDGLELYIDPSVMIPREGSERVVHLAEILYRSTHDFENPRILDLGTGSGCLLLALLQRFPLACGVGVDCCNLEVAERNARHLFPLRCEYLVGTFATPPVGIGTFDIIVANPPYYTRKGRRRLNSATVAQEPHSALFVDNDDPLRHYRDIVSSIPVLANRNCVVAMEIFRDNAKGVAELFMGNSWLTALSVGKDGRNSIRSIQGIYSP